MSLAGTQHSLWPHGWHLAGVGGAAVATQPGYLWHMMKWAIACLLCLAAGLLPLAAQPLASSGQVIDRIVATVDNYIVLQSEVDIAVMQAKQRSEALPTEGMECAIFEQLLISKLMLAKAEYDSVSVDPQQVDEEMERRMEYMLAQMGGRERVEKLYKKSLDQLKTDLRKQLREQLLAQKMEGEITKNIKVTPGEVRRFFNEIPKDSLPYFRAELQVSQLVLLPKIGRRNRNETRKKLTELRDRIKAGESFEVLARVYSEDLGSAQQGGDLGLAKPGMMVPEFERAALRLRPDELSEPVESKFGLHLIQLIEKQGSDYRCRHILMKPEASYEDKQAAMAQLDSIRSLIVLDSISFAKAAKKYSDDEATKELGGALSIDRNVRIPVDKLEPDIFFIIDTMQVGQVSGVLPYRTRDGREAFRIILLGERSEPHTANLTDDYQKIYNATLLQKKNKVLTEWFQKSKRDVFIRINEKYQDCTQLGAAD